MKDKKKLLMSIASVLEMGVAILVLAAVGVSIALAVFSFMTAVGEGSFQLEEFMEMALTLIVAVEFVKMLLLHTPESVIEVVLYAVARQIILSHDSAMDNLIGVLAIAVVFLLRSRYLKEFLLNRKKDLSQEKV